MSDLVLTQWWKRLSSLSSCDMITKDLTIETGDGEKIFCHKLVLGLASPFLNNLLQEEGADCLLLPDASVKSIKTLMSLLYNRQFPRNIGDQSEVDKLAQLLGFRVRHGGKNNIVFKGDHFEQINNDESVFEEKTTFLYVDEAHPDHTLTLAESESFEYDNDAGLNFDYCKRLENNIDPNESYLGIEEVIIEERAVLCEQPNLGSETSHDIVNVPIETHEEVIQNTIEVDELAEKRDEIKGINESKIFSRAKNTLSDHDENGEHQDVLLNKKPISSAPRMNCPTCFKSMTKRHYVKHHRASCNKEIILKCEHCGREGFCNSSTLQDHIRAKHTKEKPFKCDYCVKSFPAASHLAHHRMKNHQVNSKGEFQPKSMFPCLNCGKILTTKPKLLAHIKVVHQGIREFRCSSCDKSFSSKSNLDIHMGTIHTGDLPYKCEFCTKSFARKNLLRAHRQTTHQFIEAKEVHNQC